MKFLSLVSTTSEHLSERAKLVKISSAQLISLGSFLFQGFSVIHGLCLQVDANGSVYVFFLGSQ